MPYPEQHNLLTVHWSDSRTSGVEGGQFGLRFQGPMSDLDGLGSAAGFLSTYWAAATSAIAPSKTLTFLRLARIDTDGRYVPGVPSVDYTYPTPIAGGGSTSPSLALQLSLVATLTTALSRGLAYKGRVYLPPIQFDLDGTARWTTGQVNSAMNTFSACLSGLSGGPLGLLSVYSKGNAATPGGARQTVTGVYADTKPDTQRRRATAFAGIKGAVQTIT